MGYGDGVFDIQTRLVRNSDDQSPRLTEPLARPLADPKTASLHAGGRRFELLAQDGGARRQLGGRRWRTDVDHAVKRLGDGSAGGRRPLQNLVQCDVALHNLELAVGIDASIEPQRDFIGVRDFRERRSQ